MIHGTRPTAIVTDDLTLWEPDLHDKMNTSSAHYLVTLRDVEVYVTGEVEEADRDVGIMSCYFIAQAVYDVEGNRLRLLENNLTDDEWAAISEQVDVQVDWE